MKYRPKHYNKLQKQVLPPSVYAAIERDRQRVKAKRTPSPAWNDKATAQSRAIVPHLKALNAVWGKPTQLKAFVAGRMA